VKIGSLFSGIGGLELGLERAGLGHVVWQCEIDSWCRQVLAKHWPEATRYEDVRSVGRANAAPVDVICGGFPCQDVSLAGKRAGLDGARSGLWFEYRRIVEELAPSVVVIENVLGLRTSGLRRVLADLAALGFDAEWSDLAASDVGAPHRRRRLFIVATHPERLKLRNEPEWLGRACRAAAAESRDDGEGWDATDACGPGRRERRGEEPARAVLAEPAGSGGARDAADADGEGEPQSRGAFSEQWRRARDGSWRPPVSPIRRVDDGIRRGSHGRRLKALGNAVVPQCAEVIGRALLGAMQEAA